MAIPPGTHTLGPGDGSLTVRTGKTGPAAKAGHDLLIEVRAWQEAAGDPAATSMTLTADSRSLHVLEGTGGVGALGDEEKAAIRTSIDDDVLKGGTIAFRSTSVTPQGDGGLHVAGELDLLGTTQPVEFVLATGEDGRVQATATVRQTAWGIKPFSILFGTMKVADEVRVELDARLAI
jgi:polyisoprenoid-binding protein YceI